MAETIQNAASRAARFSGLLEVMLEGGDSKAVAAAKDLISDARPEDLLGAVDAAVASDVGFAALKPAVSRLVNLLSASLKRHGYRPLPGERLFASLLAENAGLAALLERGKPLARALNDTYTDASPEKPDPARLAVRGFIEELKAVEAHYRKKENVIFPWFEARYPQYRCVRLMWEIQDDARAGLKDMARLLDAGASTAQLNQALGRLYFDLNANIFREEYALFPVMARLVSAADSERLFAECLDYGWSFLDASAIESFTSPKAEQKAAAYVAGASAGEDTGASDTLPANAARAPAWGAALAASGAAASAPPAPASGFTCRTGALSGTVLDAMFRVLPVDMTFVDAEDKVRWFSDSPHRIFPRSPAILGRDVRNCHPGASVDRVMAIVEAFRRGEKDSEAFWIQMGGRFIHIEYYALRAPDGRYLGVLEASQDLSQKRVLSGQKRIADD